MVKFYYVGKYYFTRCSNLVPVFLIISFGMISFHDNPFDGTVTLRRYQYELAAFGVFVTWLLQTILMENIPKFGLYIEMLKKVSITFIHFFTAYLFLYSGFALSFYILFPDAPAFDNIALSFVKVSTAYCSLMYSYFGEENYLNTSSI